LIVCLFACVSASAALPRPLGSDAAPLDMFVKALGIAEPLLVQNRALLNANFMHLHLGDWRPMPGLVPFFRDEGLMSAPKLCTAPRPARRLRPWVHHGACTCGVTTL
jgi:hypothetical protein